MRGGGDGLVRETEVLADAHVTLLADRRKFRPHGLQAERRVGAGCPSIGAAAGKRAFRASAVAVFLRGARRGSKRRAETGGAKVKQR
jgi:N-methylhydantoinase B